jgi:hypothetical protein
MNSNDSVDTESEYVYRCRITFMRRQQVHQMTGGCFSKKCPFLFSFFFGRGKRNDSSMMMLCDGIVMLCDAKVISKLLVNK